MNLELRNEVKKIIAPKCEVCDGATIPKDMVCNHCSGKGYIIPLEFGCEVIFQNTGYYLFTYLGNKNLNEEILRKESLKEAFRKEKEVKGSLGWEPKEEEDYYFIGTGGSVVTATHNHLIDITRIKSGNAYRTEEEAQKVLDKRKALHRIHVYMMENGLLWTPDWGDSGGTKYLIEGWSYGSDIPATGIYVGVDTSKGNLVFKSEEEMERVLNNCKDDLETFLKD